MTTSRTGTSTWKRVRLERLNHDREAGLTHCPLCKVWLDWEYSRRPNSPEPDHIIPWIQNGPNTFENTRTICRRCNQSLGNKAGRAKKVKTETVELDSSPIW